MQSSDEDIEQEELSFIADKNENGTTTLNVLSVSYKTKHILLLWSKNHTPVYLLISTENLQPHKNLHMNVYSIFIHDFQNLETTISFNRWNE